MGCDLKACVVCLSTATDVKLIEIGESEIRKLYNSTAGLQTTECDVLPNYICIVCLAQTRSFHAFRNKCQRSYFFILQELGKHETITEECLRLLDRTALGISSKLSFSETLAFSTNTESDLCVISFFEISHQEISIKEASKSENESIALEDNLIDLTELDNSLLDHKEEVTLITEPDETKVTSLKKQPKAIKKRIRKEPSKVNTLQNNKKIDISKYLSCRLLTPEEQYGTVLDRKKTEKYLKAKYKCKYCFKVFKVESTLCNHLRRHDHKLFGQMQCDICKSCFNNTRRVKMHIDKLHTYKFACNQCKFICVDRCLALKHHLYHENVTYCCPHCDQKFMNYTTCLSHIRMQHPSAHLCQICGNNFLTRNGLKRHQKLVHSDEEMRKVSDMILDIEGPLYCKDCNIQFVSTEAFDNHLNHSTKHQPNKKKSHNQRLVEECDVTQTSSHTGEKPYQCEQCELRFSTKGNYRRHVVVVHEKTKRYKCDLCDKTFTQQYTVKLHKKTVHMKIPHPPWQNYNRRLREKKAAAVCGDTATSYSK